VNVEASTSRAPRVLVVEDDDAIREVITDVLDDHGFRVASAGNGEEALAALDRSMPDVVVLDLLMPVMHGWAFMESYGDKTKGAPIPIVVVSANPILPRSYDRLGVRRCIGKPFALDDLIDAVEDALRPSTAA
jgi:CheY-like chemotaxis protein